MAFDKYTSQISGNVILSNTYQTMTKISPERHCSPLWRSNKCFIHDRACIKNKRVLFNIFENILQTKHDCKPSIY